MTNEEILNQSFKEIKSKIPLNHFCLELETEQTVQSFGLVPSVEYEFDVKQDNYREFYPILYCTRNYRDPGCATYKLIKILQTISDRYKEVFWRVNPVIEEEMDFDQYYPRYRGFFRAAV